MTSYTPRLDNLEQNLIINGNFDFWQRGTSASVTNNSKYLADRFLFQTNNATYTTTASQSTDVPTYLQSGYQSRYSLLLTNGTGNASPGATDAIDIQYRVEGQDYQRIHGRSCRFQFCVKTSVVGTYTVSFQNSANNRSYVTTFYVPAANTWTKITIDLTMDSSGTWNFDNTIGLLIFFGLTYGSSAKTSTLNAWQNGNFQSTTSAVNWGATTGATFQLSQVMLIPQDFTQAGSSTVDVPFQRCGRSIGHELQMCQRYYEKSYDVEVAPGTATFNGQSQSASNSGGDAIEKYTVTYRVNKRTTPTFTSYSPATGGSGVCYVSENGNAYANVSVTAFSNSSSSTTISKSASGVTYSIGQFHWTADAEL